MSLSKTTYSPHLGISVTGLEDIPASKKSEEVAFESDSPYIYVYSWDFYCYHFYSSWMSPEQLLI
jgi:hypothetical protein